MALQDIPGGGMWMPHPMLSNTLAFSTTLVIDATGEKIAYCGQIWTPNRGTKTINKVHLRWGAVTKAGGSALTISLQNIATTAPMTPDEVQDQFRAIPNADITANGWYTSGLITSDGTDGGTKRAVVFGEPIAVVIEFDGAGRLATDSFIVSAANGSGILFQTGSSAVLKTAGWAAQTVLPNMVFEFSDGTFGGIDGSFPATAINTHGFKQDTAVADEYALEFQVPFACKVDAASFLAVFPAITADIDVVLYSGTTPLATVAVKGEWANSTSSTRNVLAVFPAAVTLAENTTYRCSIRPTQTVTVINIYSIDVASAAHLALHPGGTAWTYATRLNDGAWAAPTLTRRLLMALRFCAIDDGVAPTITYPPASKVYAGTDRGDGTIGTLHASNIATAVGAGVNLTPSILLTGNTVDDVVGTHTEPVVTFPLASRVYAGVNRGDGVVGTLHASNIATAAGAGSNLAAGDLRLGVTVDDVAGALNPTGGAAGGAYTFID